MARLVECVPNFSEGRNRAVIDAIADAIKGVADVKLLDVDPGADTNRTVYTFVGPPEAVADAALKAAQQAYELIDMAKHRGAHPRMGAMDVCPIVPISGVTMDECVEISRGIGRRIADGARACRSTSTSTRPPPRRGAAWRTSAPASTRGSSGSCRTRPGRPTPGPPASTRSSARRSSARASS